MFLVRVTPHINTLCGQNAVVSNVEPGGTNT